MLKVLGSSVRYVGMGRVNTRASVKVLSPHSLTHSLTRSLTVLKHGISAVELEEELGSFPSVKLRGLPYNASLDDITDFLSGLIPLDIVVPNNNENGSIGVLFATIDDANAALERDKDNMGSRYIDVIRIPRSEYYQMAMESVARGSSVSECGSDAVNENMMRADEGSVVKMTGLPFQATLADIQKFFGGFDISADNVILEARRDGKPSGNAYVVFSSAEEAIESLKYDRQYMGKRYINLQVTKTEYALNCDRLSR